MKFTLQIVRCGLLTLACGLIVIQEDTLRAEPIEIAEINRKTDVDFEKEILPILRKNCLACHNSTDAESDLVLETPTDILKGGIDGPAVIANKGSESLLILLASRAQESFMPPDDNDVGAKMLTPAELGLIKLWIDQGAEGEVSGGRGPVQWQPLPPGVNPIYSVAISEDGQYAAAGRANQIFLYHVPSRKEIGRLSDPAVSESGIYDSPGVSFMDLVQSITFSPGGDMIAAGGYRTVKIWQRQDNLTAGTLPALADSPTAGAASGDGSRLGIGLNNGSLQLVDLAENKIIKSVNAHEGAVTGVAFTQSGDLLVTSGADSKIKIWNSADLTEVRAIVSPAVVNDVAVVSENAQIAAAGEDKIIRIWSITKPEAEGEELPLKEIPGHGARVTSLVSFGEKGDSLISGSDDKTARHWSVSTGKQVRSMSHGGEVVDVAVNPDGTQFVSVSINKTAKIWNLADGKMLAEMSGDYRAKAHVAKMQRASELAVKRVALAKKDLDDANARKKSEDDNLKKVTEALTKADEDVKAKTEATVKPNADLKMADETLAAAVTTKTDAEAAQKDMDAKKVAADTALKEAQEQLKVAQAALQAAGDDEEKKKAAQTQVDTATAAVTAATEAQKAAVEAKKVADAAVVKSTADHKAAEAAQKKAAPIAQKANDEKAAADRAQAAAKRSKERAEKAVANAADAIVGFDSSHKSEEEQAAAAKEIADTANGELGKTDQAYASVTYNGDGTQIIVGGLDHYVSSFDSLNGSAISVYQEAATATRVVVGVGNHVVVLREDKSGVKWVAQAEWKLIRTIGNPETSDMFTDRVTALDFNSDGTRLAAGGGEPSRNGELKIFSVEDGKLIEELKDPHSDTIFAVDFSRDDQYIATCGADRFVKVFQASDGEFVRAFEGHTHHVLGVSWSADGRELASAGADKVIKLWDFRSGDQKRTITGFGKEVTSIQYAGLTTNVVASCGDKNVHIKRADNGGNVRALAGSTDYVYNVSVSGDGKTIVAGGQDSVFRLWSDDGKAIGTFDPPVVEPVASGDGDE